MPREVLQDRLLSAPEITKILSKKTPNPNFYCLFSSQFMGFTNDPHFFTVPIDDHGFHRGDGVFEAIRVVDGKVFLLQPHLERLKHSAGQIKLELPLNVDEIGKICHRAVEIAGQKELILRVFVTRGGGNFGINPKDTTGSQIYIAATQFTPPSAETYKKGVRIGKSSVPAKHPFFAKVKSLNYLPNVLMKAECLERNLDYTIWVDAKGFLLESATENMVYVNKAGELVHPPLEYILRGCTMVRMFDLAEKAKLLPVVRGRETHENDLKTAQEVFMIGTTLDVLPVSEYEGTKISVGPMGLKLRDLLQKDQRA